MDVKRTNAKLSQIYKELHLPLLKKKDGSGLQQRHIFHGFIVFVVLFILEVELQCLRGEVFCFTHKLTKSNFIFRHFN